MARDSALEFQATDEFGFKAERPLHVRTIAALIAFSKRKPLGAFGAGLTLIPIFIAVFGPGLDLGVIQTPSITKYGPNDYVLGQEILEGPSWDHPMGTDHLGRDVFSRLLHGARLSFLIGWSVFAISSVMSTTLTILSAYFIHTLDLIFQRLIEIASFLPDLILIVALFSIYGATPLTMILTLGLLRGFDTGRILRSLVISVRAQPYVEAARLLGATDKRIIVRHVLPQVAYLIIVFATGGMATAVLVESGLAILGFGINPDTPTIGNLLNASRQHLAVAPQLALFPGLVLFMLLLGSRLLGDALRDVLDPRLRGEGGK